MTRNYGFSTIMNLKEANEAWDIFFNRFFSAEIPVGVGVEFDPEITEFKPREDRNAKYLPPFNTEGRKDHSDAFDDFLNGNTVHIPESTKLNEEGLAKVAKAIQEADFESESLNKKDHVFYALWLFKQNKISRQQLSTILAREQVNRLTPIRQTFQILDENGKYTAEAKRYLLPILAKKAFNGFSDRQKDRFRLLMQAAPKSEQIFYLSESNPQIITPNDETLGNALKKNKSWYTIKRKEDQRLYDVHYSFGAIEALQIAISSPHEAAGSPTLIGKISREQVKEGVSYGYRPVAISIPDSGVEPTTKDIHEYPDSPMPAVTMHDVYHAKLHNAIPPEFHLMLNHMSEIISKHTKQPWSRTLWNLADRELPISFKDQKLEVNLENGPDNFASLFNARSNPIFLNDKLTDEGIALIWHMVNHAEVWKNLYKVDIEKLNNPYKAQIQKMKAFSKTLDKDEHPKLLNLKFRFFCAIESKNYYQHLVKMIDTLRDHLIAPEGQRLVFGKYNHDLEFQNQIILKLQKFKSGTDLLIDEENVKELIPFLFHKTLMRGNETFIQAEAEKIARNFKSFSEKNCLSDEALDEALEKFASVEEKVQFLESCYELLAQSRAYVRKNPLLDTLFTFFRNPMTSSQRQHVSQLQAKLQEVLAEFHDDNELDGEAKEELHWRLKHCELKLAKVHTERFMVNFSLPLSNP